RSMWPCTRAGNPRIGRCGMAVLAVFFFGLATASADRLPADPAETLSQALKDPADRSDLDKLTADLRTLSEMRRGIAALYDLPRKMSKNRADEALRARDQLIGRFQNAARAAMREGDTDRRVAAVVLVGEMGVSLPGPRATTSLAGHLFTADLI